MDKWWWNSRRSKDFSATIGGRGASGRHLQPVLFRFWSQRWSGGRNSTNKPLRSQRRCVPHHASWMLWNDLGLYIPTVRRRSVPRTAHAMLWGGSTNRVCHGQHNRDLAATGHGRPSMPTHIRRELSVIVIVDLGVSSNQWWRRSGGWGGARAHKRRDRAEGYWVEVLDKDD
jgi:hypothetical protein